ncbi:hypothetical protein Thiofri_04343 [Thiorhodovibrio frisius]|nr:hypothetical protein Thiofri_04343 [Thiorhodovibrio frisius]
MAWLYLIIAGIFEWGWPVGLKLGLTDGGMRWGWILFSVLCMTAKGAAQVAVTVVARAVGAEQIPGCVARRTPLALHPSLLAERSG